MPHSCITPILAYFKPTFTWIPQEKSISPEKMKWEHTPYAGKLLLREEINMDNDTLQQHIDDGYFTTVASVETYFWGHRCRRCGNKTKHLFGTMPCSRCRQTHVYCRNCVEMGRVLACEPLYYWTGPTMNWPEQPQPLAWTGELTTFQQRASDTITKAMNEPNSELLVWAVCGAGKTEMVFQGIESLIQTGKRVCLATPRADVVRELIPRFQRAFPKTTIQGLYGGSEDKDKPGQLVISTTHQLLRYAHAFDAVIIDEIDAFPYHQDKSLHFAAKRAGKPDAPRIYLTATPRAQQKRRIDAKQLPTVFVPVRFHGHPLPVPTLRMCFDLKKALKKFHPPAAFVEWFFRRANQERQLLIFVPTIELAEKMTENLPARLNVDTKEITFVHAPDADRAEKVQQFRHKNYSILVTTTILERGVTFPSVDVVILDAGHEVFDEAALVQIAGRAGRSSDDPTGEVIFYHDGKSNAMVQAVRSIIEMNKRGRKL